jgi:hypothetical protein
VPNPGEVVEVPAGAVDGANFTFTTSRPYIAGSVSVYLNGLLMSRDSWQELPSPSSTVTLLAAPLAADVVQVSYLDASYRPLYEDPRRIIHISELKQADVVRIAMKAGHHLNPSSTVEGLKLTVVPKERAAKSFSRTVFLGYIMQNLPIQGKLILDVDGRTKYEHYTATVPYVCIANIQRYTTPGDWIPDQGSRPGSHALGTVRPGFMKLVAVRT